MIVTNDAEKTGPLRSLRNQGRDVFDSWLSHTRLGFNYRLNVTESLGDASLALPFSGVMTEEQVDRVCRELVAVLDAVSVPA